MNYSIKEGSASASYCIYGQRESATTASKICLAGIWAAINHFALINGIVIGVAAAWWLLVAVIPPLIVLVWWRVDRAALER